MDLIMIPRSRLSSETPRAAGFLGLPTTTLKVTDLERCTNSGESKITRFDPPLDAPSFRVALPIRTSSR
ncbi:hypothetical protein D3C77_551500 [compost metagenome]